MNQPESSAATSLLKDLPDQLRPFVTENEDGSFQFTLAYPVKHGEEVITSIKGRRPVGKQLRNWDMDDKRAGTFMDMFGRLTGTPAIVMDQLDSSDVLRAIGLVAFFLGSGLGTGQT